MSTMEKTICENFLYNPYVNPLTKEPIKHDEKIELMELCSPYVVQSPYSVEEKLAIEDYCSGISTDTKEYVKTLMMKKFKKPSEHRLLERKTFDPKNTRYCYSFVPKNNEIPCSSIRTIVVLDFMNASEDNLLLQDHHFCDMSYVGKIKNYIIYIPIPYASSIPDLSYALHALKSNCNEMVIHLDLRTKHGKNDSKLFNNAIRIINKYLGGYEILKTMYIFMNYSEPLFLANETQVSHVSESLFNVLELRVLNVHHEKDLEFIKKDEHTIFFHPFDENDDAVSLSSRSNRLSCQWWFKRFFSTVFECGKGRLVQFSDTCYMATSFNTAILSNYFKKIIIRNLSMIIGEGSMSDADLYDIHTPIDYGVCVDFDRLHTKKERVKYYAKIFSNTLCKTSNLPRINLLYRDIFLNAGKSYFGSKSRGGGIPSAFMFKMLLDLKINFVIADETGAYYDPYSPNSLEFFRNIREGGYHLPDLLEDLNTTSVFSLQETIKYPDVVFYIGSKEVTSQTMLPTLERLYRLNFLPETCSIALTYFDLGKNLHGHVITGFVCDGYYKLYDSYFNIIDNCDWRDPAQILDNSFIKTLSTLNNNYNFTDGTIDFCIFVNYNRRLQYVKEGSVCIF